MCDENTLASHGTFTWIVSPHIQLFSPLSSSLLSFLLAFYDTVYHKSLTFTAGQNTNVYFRIWIHTERKSVKVKRCNIFGVRQFMRHAVSGTCVTPLYCIPTTAYCRIQTFLMDLSPGFYEALPSDLKTTTRVALNHKITRRKKPCSKLKYRFYVEMRALLCLHWKYRISFYCFWSMKKSHFEHLPLFQFSTACTRKRKGKRTSFFFLSSLGCNWL